MTRSRELADVDRLRAANRLRSTAEGREAVSAATVVGLWLVIPCAIAAFALLVLGIVWLTLPLGDDGDYPWVWVRVLATAVLLMAYWAFLAVRAGRSALWGLWVLAPVVALVPTFVIARDAAAGATARGSEPELDATERRVAGHADMVELQDPGDGGLAMANQ